MPSGCQTQFLENLRTFRRKTSTGGLKSYPASDTRDLATSRQCWQRVGVEKPAPSWFPTDKVSLLTVQKLNLIEMIGFRSSRISGASAIHCWSSNGNSLRSQPLRHDIFPFAHQGASSLRKGIFPPQRVTRQHYEPSDADVQMRHQMEAVECRM